VAVIDASIVQTVKLALCAELGIALAVSIVGALHALGDRDSLLILAIDIAHPPVRAVASVAALPTLLLPGWVGILGDATGEVHAWEILLALLASFAVGADFLVGFRVGWFQTD